MVASAAIKRLPVCVESFAKAVKQAKQKNIGCVGKPLKFIFKDLPVYLCRLLPHITCAHTTGLAIEPFVQQVSKSFNAIS